MVSFKSFVYSLFEEQPKVVPSPLARVAGVKKSPFDARDFKFSTAVEVLPPRAVVSSLSGVETQGSWQSCVAHAITSAVEQHSLKNSWPSYYELSRMHVWNEARKLDYDDSWQQNKGVYIRSAWKAAQAQGIVIEKLFPYSVESYNQEPGLAALIWRRWYTPFKYNFITSNVVDVVKHVLAQRDVPVVFGLYSPASLKAYTGGVLADLAEPTAFAHAMLIIGYDDSLQAFKVRNSWGVGWGELGDCWLPYDLVERKGFDFTFCTVVDT